MDVLEWLRATCAEFEFDVVAVYRRGGEHSWPLVGVDPGDLERKLADGGHLIPLPKEPAALANVLEVASSTSCSIEWQGWRGQPVAAEPSAATRTSRSAERRSATAITPWT